MVEYVKVDQPILIIGYDWERYGKEDLSADEQKKQQETDIKGLQIICTVHKSLEKPFTLFVLGKMLEKPHILETLLSELSFKKIRELVDLEQHAYSHVEFKKLPGRVPLTPNQIEWEVSHTRELIKNKTGYEPIGIRPPQGHYKGLQSEYEILGLLYKEGIRFISSDLRNEKEQFPSSWYDDEGNVRQPYYYDMNRFKDLIEIPTHGWNDNALKGMSRTTKVRKHTLEEEVEIHKTNIDFAVENILCYAPLFHPWATAMTDEQGYVISSILKYASKSGMRVMNYKKTYQYIISMMVTK
ncbi:MAG: hypothetical protein QMC83_08060 [Thermodesulfovibrionales bacterium]|nr:hypothetical protein [Thermodesulfovibrionales bacterium]